MANARLEASFAGQEEEEEEKGSLGNPGADHCLSQLWHHRVNEQIVYSNANPTYAGIALRCAGIFALIVLLEYLEYFSPSVSDTPNVRPIQPPAHVAFWIPHSHSSIKPQLCLSDSESVNDDYVSCLSARVGYRLETLARALGRRRTSRA